MLSEYLQSRFQKAIFHGESLELPSNISIALTSDLPEDSDDGETMPEIPETIMRSGVNETGQSGLYEYNTGYARVSVATPAIDGSQNWKYVGSGTIENVRQVVFDTCREHWGVVSGVAIMDTSNYGEGNILYYGQLEYPRHAREGDAIKFDANELDICLE